MLKQFKKINVTEVTPYTFKQLQDNVEQYLNQLANYPTIPSDLEIARLKKPRLSYNATSRFCIVEASTEVPKYFFLNKKIWGISETITFDPSKTGLGGLDAGTVAADTVYYIYAVLQFDTVFLVGSLIDPASGGPTDYDFWTYLGAIGVNNTPDIEQFQYCRGRYWAYGLPTSGYEESESTAAETTVTLNVPVTARAAIIRLFMNPINSVNEDIDIGASSGQLTNFYRPTSTSTAAAQTEWAEVPIITPKTIYEQHDSNSSTAKIRVVGWIEDPEEFQ